MSICRCMTGALCDESACKHDDGVMDAFSIRHGDSWYT